MAASESWVKLIGLSSFVCSFLLLPKAVVQENEFALGVRTTEPLTPEQELQSFQLPTGFKIELVASEPEIDKPMNLAFDAQGRLWVTSTLEYPYAAVDREGKDSIKIIESIGVDGRSAKVTTFAEGLNIPTGILPYQDGAIAWSIPNIWRFRDTNGDGVSDQRSKLYGPLGWERDTHGMNSSFRRGFDGWIYATHGFNNESVLVGGDGHRVPMQSGNTYRFRGDGFRAERHTFGQVNPFGLCFDAWGHIYSADCHSAPIYQLIEGGYYPSFGKPHDGLGFAPTLMQHSHGSTAIAGIVYCQNQTWPEAFQNNVFVGNVMTSRINRDGVVFKGSSPTAIELDDFLISSDPWFRPVDIRFGPDGALYIADFYNRIIGHYEVKLDHPGRDRKRGRIWRVSYQAETEPAKSLAQCDWTNKSLPELVALLDSDVLEARMSVTDWIVDHYGHKAKDLIGGLLRTDTLTEHQIVQALWILHRVNGVESGLLADYANHTSPLVRAHVLRIHGKQETLNTALVASGIDDDSPFVQRAAAECVARKTFVGKALLRRILARWRQTPSDDDHLVYALSVAVREQFRYEEAWDTLSIRWLKDESVSALLSRVALAVNQPASAQFLMSQLQAGRVSESQLLDVIGMIAEDLKDDQGLAVIQACQQHYESRLDLQLAAIKRIRISMLNSDGPTSEAFRLWGGTIAEHLFEQLDQDDGHWRATALDGGPAFEIPWFIQSRRATETTDEMTFLCSLPPGGERLTGILRSGDILCPSELTFYLAGHRGYPQEEAHQKNLVRLVDTQSGAVLKVAYPPRHDEARRLVWELSRYQGRKVRLEVVDGDTGDGYAWLAVGQFSHPDLVLPKKGPRDLARDQVAVFELVRDLQLAGFGPMIKRLVADRGLSPAALKVALEGLLMLSPNTDLAIAIETVIEPQLSTSLRNRLVEAVLGQNVDQEDVIRILFEQAPLSVQRRLGLAMAARRDSAARLVALMEKGIASPLVAQSGDIRLRLGQAGVLNLETRLAALASRLPDSFERISKRVDVRIQGYREAMASASKGQAVFQQMCALCHQIGGAGALVGPQLDGIGNRGLARLAEDVLAPNRNLDSAFRSVVFVMADERIYTGMVQSENDRVVRIKTVAGESIELAKTNLVSRTESALSLMPDNFGDALDQSTFNHLMRYLLLQK